MSTKSTKKQATLKPRTIFCRDNLEVMRGINSESVDLIYLDPPFNKGREFHAPIGSTAQGADFSDIWLPSSIKDGWHNEINDKHPALYKYLDAVGDIGSTSAKYYLIYMAVRLMEMHRILKDTGSIYLHCDPTASHYLKLLMDTIFGHQQFRNEIVWLRATKPKHSPEGFGAFSDHILFYTKSPAAQFHPLKAPMTANDATRFSLWEEETERHYYLRSLDIDRKDGRTGNPVVVHGKTYVPRHGYGWQWSQETIDDRLKENPLRIEEADGLLFFRQYAAGVPVHNVWTDIPPVPPEEYVGYPTQKPTLLLERVIKASSVKGELVLDPFCGCATTCVAAEKLGREWVGVDVSKKAYELVNKRLKQEIPPTLFNPTLPIFRKDIPARTDLGRKQNPTRKDKQLLYGLQNGNCKGCGTHFEIQHFQIDHIIPRAHGGSNELDNLQLLCGNCNSIKGDRPMEYLRARLKQLYG